MLNFISFSQSGFERQFIQFMFNLCRSLFHIHQFIQYRITIPSICKDGWAVGERQNFASIDKILPRSASALRIPAKCMSKSPSILCRLTKICLNQHLFCGNRQTKCGNRQLVWRQSAKISRQWQNFALIGIPFADVGKTHVEIVIYFASIDKILPQSASRLRMSAKRMSKSPSILRRLIKICLIQHRFYRNPQNPKEGIFSPVTISP